MVYSEKYAWPLTSPTTCYTAARVVERDVADGELKNKMKCVRWATERHTVQVELFDNKDHPLFTSQEIFLPVDKDSICVGYASIGDWEALALLDTSKLPSTERVDTTNVVPEPTGTDDASVTVASGTQPPHHRRSSSFLRDDGTVSSGTQQQQQPQNHHRRSSSFISLSESSLPSIHMLGADSTTGGSTTVSHHTSVEMENVLDDRDLPGHHSPTVEKVAQLILQNADGVQVSTTLNFRPLAITLCNLVPGAPHVWCGGADNNKLHLFAVTKDDDGICSMLNPVTLDDPSFLFRTAIMSIDIDRGDDQTFCLAVACQDGTVRVIQFTFSDNHFENVKFVEVIIDGPIVCIHLERRQNSQHFHLVAGSLCGYVAELYLDRTEFSLSGPFMIAEGFWNTCFNAEDSVLAVLLVDDLLAFGTCSGRCFIFGDTTNLADKDAVFAFSRDRDSRGDDRLPSYFSVQEFQLPYSIHGISRLEDGRLLVTTQRSVHLFSDN
jgi:hypothetical protein